MKKQPVNYHDYLQLDAVLEAQTLESAKYGKPAHEEMLFIIIHQAYELWFKQILHETESIREMFIGEAVDEEAIGVASARLGRVIEILKLLVDQVRILETMTPLDFLEFRNYLTPASGFQSFQFRLLEVRLGLLSGQRYNPGAHSYVSYQRPLHQAALKAAEAEPSLFDLVERWLTRTPFLQLGDFDFPSRYLQAVNRMLETETDTLRAAGLPEEEVNRREKMLAETRAWYRAILTREEYERLRADNQARIAWPAAMAALFIHVYRDAPILHVPYQFLTRLVEIDDLLSGWRHRHARMVLKMLGRKMGTGGSAGFDYLLQTVEKHRIFTDFYAISTLLIPRSELPELPDDLRRNLAFHYTAGKH